MPAENAPSRSPAVLACERCTKLKVKCGKEQPSCAQCQRAGHQCVPVFRTRRPRGRNGGRPSNNRDLIARLARLENLVVSLSEKSPTTSSGEIKGNDESTSTAQGHISDGLSSTPTRDSPSNISPQRFVPEDGTNGQQSATSLGQSLFTQLSDALGEIKEILNEDDAEVVTDPTMNGTNGDETRYNYDTSRHLFSSPGSPPYPSAVPTPDQTILLIRTFRQRVHPLTKVVHMPTLEREMAASLINQGCWAGDAQQAAVHAAAIYVSISSLTDAECWQSLGQAKSELQATWRLCVEHQIANSNFLVSERLETLQALVLYLVAVRSHDASRTVWTLLPLAIRIAQALHLHREESLKACSPLEGHIRRCIWYCLLLLDFQAAMDRGSDTIISERGSSTRLPMHINDSQLDWHGHFPQSPDQHVNELTFCAMGWECTAPVRSLNFVEPADMERAPSALQYNFDARNDIVSRLERRFEWYISLPSYGEQNAAYRDLARTIISAMRLYVVRPLQSHPAMKAPNVTEFNVLRLAKETLSANLALNEDKHVWNWYVRMFNNWHPLAVLLAELAVTNNAEASDAWPIAKRAYSELGASIAEGVSGPLWRPITKLMRAAERRQNISEHNANGGIAGELDLDFPDVDVNMMSEWSGFDQPWAYWEAFIDDLAGSENLPRL